MKYHIWDVVALLKLNNACKSFTCILDYDLIDTSNINSRLLSGDHTLIVLKLWIKSGITETWL